MSPALKDRQIQILARVADGKVPKQIIREMQITEHVYKDQMAEIRHRLNAKTTAHAVALALRHGVLQ